MTTEIKRGVEKGVEQQRKEFKKQQGKLSKTRNKMVQLENSLNVSAKKYQQASEEIRKLKEQIEKGVTPQIEGLLEEKTLLGKPFILIEGLDQKRKLLGEWKPISS